MPGSIIKEDGGPPSDSLRVSGFSKAIENRKLVNEKSSSKAIHLLSNIPSLHGSNYNKEESQINQDLNDALTSHPSSSLIVGETDIRQLDVKKIISSL